MILPRDGVTIRTGSRLGLAENKISGRADLRGSTQIKPLYVIPVIEIVFKIRENLRESVAGF